LQASAVTASLIGTKEAAAAKGVSLSKEEAREIIYGTPYETWKGMFQTEIPAKPQKHAG
jgi:hypothetical protein